MHNLAKAKYQRVNSYEIFRDNFDGKDDKVIRKDSTEVEPKPKAKGKKPVLKELDTSSSDEYEASNTQAKLQRFVHQDSNELSQNFLFFFLKKKV